MGKYRLRARQKNALITVLEVDTESRAWYLKADDEKAAIKSLQEMSKELVGVDSFFVNGKNVTNVVISRTQESNENKENILKEENSKETEIQEIKLPNINSIENKKNIVLPSIEEIKKASEISKNNFDVSEKPSKLVMPKVLPKLKKVETKKENKKFDGMLIGKKKPSGECMDISNIHTETGSIVVKGKVVSFDIKELRPDPRTKAERKLLVMDIADNTNGISCKKFFSNASEAEVVEQYLKKGIFVKIRGSVQLDNFSGGLVLQISQMCVCEVEQIEHIDDAELTRVELHLHTKMSLDGLIDNEEIIKTAKKWNHPAVAITDHGVIQAFPKIQELAAKYNQKVIYGMEGYMIEDIPENVDEDRQKYNHIIVLAKNMTGMRNLYRLVTISHLKFFRKRPLMPRAILEEFHEGLLYGTACVAGEFFRAVLNNESDEQLIKRAKFYDYLEVQPIGNNSFMIADDKFADITTIEDLQNLNKRIIDIGEKAGIPVCATSDAHYMFKEQSRKRELLLSMWEKPGEAESHPPVFVRTTNEMLEDFNYLPKEKAKEIVITNTRKIADSCEWVEPLAEEWKSYNPKIFGADDKLVNMCYQNAYKIYGNPLPKIVKDRLELELTPIIRHGYGVLYYIAHKLVKHSNDRGYLVGSRGSVGSSFVATMSQITEVNPLEPHYVCLNCHWSHFYTDGSVGGGFDLPDKKCPKCGTELNKDGHNIPFAVFLGFDGDKVPDIDLNFSSGDDQAVAHKYTEELFGRDNVFRAGTIAGIQDRTAFGLVKKYAENRQLNVNDIFIESLSSDIVGVKRTTGQHPAGIMVCPRDMDIHNFTPLQYAANKKYEKDEAGNVIPGTITTHFDYHSISGRMLKLDILGHDDPKIIRMLQDITGIDPLHIPFNDPKVLSLFQNTDALGITSEELEHVIGHKGIKVGAIGLPEYGTPFVRVMLEDTKPKNFSELVRISGFSHGTDVWLNNAKDLITSGKVKLEEAISTRDDIMNYLMKHGVDALISFKTMENVRKGKGLEKGNSNNEKYIREAKVPEWFIESCKKISYLFPRSHAVAYVMMAFRIAWFKVYYPLAFYASYFTIRAEGSFNAPVILKGLESQRKELLRISSMERPTNVDKENATVIEVAAEMYLRGYEFLPVSLTESDAYEFKIVDGKLLPPFNCIPALGNQVAKEIVQARKESKFTSKEDLKKRGKVSQSVIETMEDMGMLNNLPDEEQINLFSF